MLRKDLSEFSRTFRSQVANFNQEEESLAQKKRCRQKSTTFYVHCTFFVRLAVFEIIKQKRFFCLVIT